MHKMLVPLVCLVFLVTQTSAGSSKALSVKEMFRKFLIVPQIIPVAPDDLLTEVYGEFEAKLGNRLPPCATTILAIVSWKNVDENSLYTLLRFDPDYPQFFASDGTVLLAGLIVNVLGADYESGDTITSYRPSYPPPGTRDHRYICLAFKQPCRIDITTQLLLSTATRPFNFNVTQFIARYNLGVPIAGNFYRARQELCTVPQKSTDSCYENEWMKRKNSS